MRSRSCSVDGPEDGDIQRPKGFKEQDEGKTPEGTKTRMKGIREEKDGRLEVSGMTKKPQKSAESQRAKTPDLTKKDLIQLLGIMEGEVQAREDFIRMLKSDRTRPETLEAHYGSAIPTRPLQALQRDAMLLHSSCSSDDVYQKPMVELDRLEVKQKETYRRMLEQLLLAEKIHRRTVAQLDHEKQKHADFISKSDDFTDLLEQERERLKRLLDQEKVFQARKDQDHSRRLEKVQTELVKLRSFTLMLVDERQLHIEQMDQQSQTIQDLAQKLQDKEQQLGAGSAATEEDRRKILRLESELELQQSKFSQEHEEMSSKMADQDSQSQQLRLKLVGLTQKVEELEEKNKVLKKSDDDLRELREEVCKGEQGSSSITAELENLRKKVLEMEEKDEEITQTESRCKELRKKLQDEEIHSKELKLKVDILRKKMVDMEKLEGSFNRSQMERSQLHASLEKERRIVKDLASELERSKAQLKDLKCSELKLEKVEMVLKDDLVKLKSFTVVLVEERKNLSERLQQEEKKREDLDEKLKTEQQKVTEVTEKLIEESKNILKLKSEMEIQIGTLTAEKEELKNQLIGEVKKSEDLRIKLKGTKTRMEGLEDTERELQRMSCLDMSPEENMKQELTLEVERLKGRLKQLEVVEGDLMKTEKGEATSPEAELRIRHKAEEVKTKELQADVQALKEKIHELMTKEDQLSQLQVDFSVLQQRFVEEEEQKKSASLEVENLSKELEAAKRYSRALRSGVNGRKMMDIPVISTAVQTDVMTNESAEDQTAAGFIRKSVLEENHLMSNLRQEGVRRPVVLERYPPASAELRARPLTPWMDRTKSVTLTQTVPEKTRDSSSLHPPEMFRRPGQPLHIRVMPDHENSTATLEITSPRAEDFFSSTSIIPTLGLQKPRITIIPKPSMVTSKTQACDITKDHARPESPVTITAISRTKGPEKTSSSGGLQSPVSIITVSTTPVAEVCSSSDLCETATGHTVIKQPESIRKYNGNIFTTEDNKIHIHLGSQFKRTSEGGGASVLRPTGLSSESLPETVLQSPRQPSMEKITPSKMTSSITITPITTVASKPPQSVPGPVVPSVRPAATRIPVSLKPSRKAVLGVSALVRSESQKMKIELRKSTVCSAASAAGGNG